MPEYGQHEIETPEQVTLEFSLAGVGSRFMAAAIDHLIQAGVYIVAALFMGISFTMTTTRGEMWMLALFLLVVFVVDWGYFTFFETIWSGQTPGKRVVDIRVIQADGRALTFFPAMTRNLVRVIDFLPSLYLAGVVTMVVDNRSRRLGDLAAGTLVVHERKSAEIEPISPYARKPSLEPPPETYDVRPLSLADLTLIETFLARRSELGMSARDNAARRVADAMRKKMGIDWRGSRNDEKFLEAVAKSLRNNASFLPK